MPTYIYAITQADHPLALEGLQGVGGEASDLRTVKAGKLAAVVSDAPDGLRAKRRDLVAHQNVLERLMADGAVLPMRFGLVGPDDGQVRAALEEGAEGYTSRLSELDGRLEYNVKVSLDEDVLLRAILTDSPEARQLSEYTRANPGAQDRKMALGELVSREVQSRQEALGRDIASSLASAAERASEAEPTKSHFFNVSYLVKRDEASAFSQTVHEEAERRGDDYQFVLNGPLPPYSFV
ncbi:GvpL/GvpF family gas vesicle protein [Streptomyces sp. NRRL WC-3549]|uniref:GvpL/GvpF family gas vesicle protein n=1 Tax=Streptomyces sp. NRRL WC-3549 TaxID=1463925 RepID=UPI0004C4D9AE|nr:GvpL/GvpF family gas vesicle protein [Streptomyces sp. NRRL WC-3549]